MLFTGLVDLYIASHIALISPLALATSSSWRRGMLSKAVVATRQVPLSPFFHAAAAPASGKSHDSLTRSLR